MEGFVTHRFNKQAQLRRSAGVWRRESSSWGEVPPFREGVGVGKNLKHGTNILLSGESELPPYANLKPEHLKRGMDFMSSSAHYDMSRLVIGQSMPNGGFSFSCLMHPLETMIDKVDRVYFTVKFMREVVDNSEAVREVWNYVRALRRAAHLRPKDWETFLPHFRGLLLNGKQTEAQRRAVATQLVIFEEEGVNVMSMGMPRDRDERRWETFLGARNEIFNISGRWEENIEQDFTRRSFLVRDPTKLDGLPLYVFEAAADTARSLGYHKATALTGPWKITLDDAMLEPILRHAKGRGFREIVYGERSRIAFLGGSGPGDNTPLLTRVLELRRLYAKEIGHASWAQLAFTRKMSTLDQAYGFLARLRRECLPIARRELQELQELADAQGAKYELEHFDLDYWRERLLEERFSLREDYFRPFFQVPVVLDGLFKFLGRLFGIRIDAAPGEAQVWDKHVHFFRVREAATGKMQASFFLDLYRRRGSKKPGFWVEQIQERSTLLSSPRYGPRLAAVHVICDFAPPQADGGPVLLTHREVAKLFHVMGAALRTLLSTQVEGLVAGTSGLELDVVNMPAHFLERWAYDKTVLRLISRHVETGDVLPEAAIESIAAARNFHNGIKMLKRTAFAQIDLDLHAQYDARGEMSVADVAKLIEAEFSVLPPRIRDHEINSLPLNGELASGLFTDLWSEALAADVFSEFEHAGLDDEEAVATLGRRFRDALLAPGAGRAPAAAFHDFLGRAPNFAAFLSHAGLDSLVEEEEDSGVEYEDVYEDDDDYVEFVDPDDDELDYEDEDEYED